MAKLALCIKRSDAPFPVRMAFKNKQLELLPINPSFFHPLNTPVELVDRAICDNLSDAGRELAETYLQLLPYLNFITPTKRMFTYTRGGSGEEARLHGDYSVAPGGHVDIEPPKFSSDPQELLNLLKQEAAREGLEEVGIVMDIDKITFSHFIIAERPVDTVHLGLLCTYEITEEQGDAIQSAEVGIIESGRMESVTDLAECQFQRLERWSRLVVARQYLMIMNTLVAEGGDGDLEIPAEEDADEYYISVVNDNWTLTSH